jgi:hypothetical protein
MPNDALVRLIRAGLITGIVDAIFASVLSIGAYGSTFARLWQGVASVPFGPSVLNGGAATVLLGLLAHFTVAFTWSAVFLVLVLAWPWLGRVVATWPATIGIAAIYGPIIWIVMSFVVIPFFTGRPPAVTYRWWVQLIAHIPFVAIPIVASIAARR